MTLDEFPHARPLTDPREREVSLSVFLRDLGYKNLILVAALVPIRDRDIELETHFDITNDKKAAEADGYLSFKFRSLNDGLLRFGAMKNVEAPDVYIGTEAELRGKLKDDHCDYIAPRVGDTNWRLWKMHVVSSFLQIQASPDLSEESAQFYTVPKLRIALGVRVSA